MDLTQFAERQRRGDPGMHFNPDCRVRQRLHQAQRLLQQHPAIVAANYRIRQIGRSMVSTGVAADSSQRDFRRDRRAGRRYPQADRCNHLPGRFGGQTQPLSFDADVYHIHFENTYSSYKVTDPTSSRFRRFVLLFHSASNTGFEAEGNAT